MLKKALLCSVLAATIAAPGSAAADDIADMIKRGLKLYEEGNISKSMDELNFALAQMRQKKAESLTAIFPEPPSGWTAEKAVSESAGAGLLGGGISASRIYKQEGGKGSAQIEIMTDSPLIQSMAMLLSNPMFLQGGSNGKLIIIKGEKAILKDGGKKRASLQTLLDNKILVKMEVRRDEKAGELVQELADKMDFAKLKELTK